MGDLESNQVIKYIDSSSPLIIEIGAYRGDDTAILLEINNSTIISVEPDPRNIPHLKGLQNRFSNLRIIERAVSDKDDDNVTFYMSQLREDADQANFSSSILKPKLHLDQNPRIIFNQRCDVKTITLDTIHKDNNYPVIDFIWADVQGAEHLMIKGGLNALKSTKYLYTEYSNEEIYENEVNLEAIINMLPFMTIVKDYGTNILFKNTLL